MEPADSRFTANFGPAPTPVSESSPSPLGKIDWANLGIKKYLILVLAVLLFIIIWTYANSPLVVTVTGSGEVSVPATNATLSFTLSATDNSISGAVSTVQGKADTMRSYLISKGVAEGDIAQSQVTAVPAALVTPGAGGFQATISMAAKTTHVTSVGGLVSDLYTNGALVVAQPVLSVENQNSLDQQAFNSAMKDAKSQAWAIGLSNWKLIQKIISISQVSSPTTSTSTTKADILATGAAQTNGVFKIVKAVSVSYKMW